MPYALDDAASAALWMLSLTENPKYEHMGALYADGDALKRTGTVTKRSGGETRGTLSVPQGALRALFHNHPLRKADKRELAGDEDQSSFSPDDRLQAQRLGVPSYISAGDRLRRFDPATQETSDVLALFPMDEFRAHLMRTLLNRAPDDPRGLER